MYNFEDIKKIEKELIKHILFLLGATVIFVTVVVLTCMNWGTEIDPVRLPEWFAYTVGAIYSVYAVFEICYYIIKIVRYRSFVYSILTGLERTIEGTVVKVDKDISYDKDLEFFSIDVKKDDNQIRSLHLDAMKDIEMFKPDEKVKLKVFGNYIKEVVS